MDRPHPLHYVTVALALLAAVFAFLAMQSANDARQAAEEARSEASFRGSSGEIYELQAALIRAGVIDDPSVMPVDQGTLDGPWGRCVTADDLERLDVDAADVELPDPCDTATVELVEDCPEPTTEPREEGVAVDEACELSYRVDGDRYAPVGAEHPADVDRWADNWRRADPVSGIDRVAEMASPDRDLFIHVIDEGWVRLGPWD